MKENRAPDVTVVIPTAGEQGRVESLYRAIATTFRQQGVSVETIVVLNGNRYCPDLRATLERNKAIRLFYLPVGDLTKAIAKGREAVTGRYFCFLDDDDQLLPDTLKLRVSLLDKSPDVDVLISNGYRGDKVDEEAVMFRHFRSSAANPLKGLTQGNWLASCGGLFRTETVGIDYFADVQKYFEWTWVAIQMSLDKKLIFDETRVFIQSDTPGSLSKSYAYVVGEIDFIHRVLTVLPVPKEYRGHLLGKLAAKHIGFANTALADERKREALLHYFNCLKTGRAGLAYLPWLRKISRK